MAKVYKLTFKLTKHKLENNSFEHFVELDKNVIVDNYIESYSKQWSDKYGTTIKCVKAEEINDFPENMKIKEE